MRAIALTWGVLGLAGIALSVVAIARLPLADVGHAFRTAILLTVCAGAIFGLWSALRERWPDIRHWRIGYRIELGWYLPIFSSVLGFAVITVVLSEAVRQPVVGPFRLGALFAVSAVTLLAFWALHRNPSFGRSLLRLIVIAATVTGLTVLILVRHDLGVVAWCMGAVALLALCIATLWQLSWGRYT
jgi:hypothetical protein